MDQYLALFLLLMFNPNCQSLRALQQASTLKKVQRVLGVPRSSLGSLSEAAGAFDPVLSCALTWAMDVLYLSADLPRQVAGPPAFSRLVIPRAAGFE